MLINVFGLWLNPTLITRVFDLKNADGTRPGNCRVLYGPDQHSDFSNRSADAVAAEINRLVLRARWEEHYFLTGTPVPGGRP